MEISKPIVNLIAHANQIAVAGTNRYFTLGATIITPVAQIPTYLPSGWLRNSQFVASRSDDFRIAVQIPPGQYQDEVMPYRDNLYMEVTNTSGLKRTSRRYRCILLTTSNPQIAGNTTIEGNLKGLDNLNLVTIEFQLQEAGYALMRNDMVTTSPVMCKLDQVLYDAYIGAKAGNDLTGKDAFKGVDIVPLSNGEVYTHVTVRDGVRLFDLAATLQDDDRYGLYSQGCGFYYRDGMFYVFPAFDTSRYQSASKVMDIYRLPEDVLPALQTTHYTNDKTTIILSTGKSTYSNKSDIKHQNDGVGARIISPDALMGTAGYYYNKGVAVTTRSDSLTEYKTVERSSGESISKFKTAPSSNKSKAFSANAFNDGQLIAIPWDSSNSDLIVPGMPCKYYYTENNERLNFIYGVVIGAKTVALRNTPGDISNIFREHTTLFVFVTNTDAKIATE